MNKPNQNEVTAEGTAPRTLRAIDNLECLLVNELARLIRFISDDSVSRDMEFTETSERDKAFRQSFYAGEIQSARGKLQKVIRQITDNPEAMDLLDGAARIPQIIDTLKAMAKVGVWGKSSPILAQANELIDELEGKPKPKNVNPSGRAPSGWTICKP